MSAELSLVELVRRRRNGTWSGNYGIDRRSRSVPDRAMGRIRLETIGDLVKHGYDLKACCGSCGHEQVLDAQEMMLIPNRPIGMFEIDAIERRLRCKKCRRRRARVTPIDSPRGPTKRRFQDAIGKN